MDIPVILTSAAVGAIVSSSFTFISQYFDRHTRREELLIKTATELAIKFVDTVINSNKEPGKTVKTPPYSWIVYEFHRNLEHLMKHHKLPKEIQEEMEKDLKNLGMSHL